MTLQPDSRGWSERLRARCDAVLTLGTLSSSELTIASMDPDALAGVERALAEASFANRFSSALEKQFAQATADAREKLFIRALLMGIMVYNLFLPINRLIMPDIFWLAAVLQLGVATPVALTIVALIKAGRLNPPPLVLAFLSTIMATAVVLFLSSRAPHIELIGCAFPLIIMSGNTMLATSFNRAAATTGLNTMVAAVAVSFHPTIAWQSKLCIILITLATSGYSLLAAYRIEASVRRAYLFSLRESYRASLLNKQLRHLAERDGLTGIANRRHFDERLAQLWNKGGPIGLAMIDIDAFKSLNDRYGHQAGDECLRRVAGVLEEETGGDATLARYGGEEFALLMAEADLERVVETAERMRMTIAGLHLPIARDEADVRVTISLGCAAVIPSPLIGRLDLVAAADAALYRAKQNGRNQTQTLSLDTLKGEMASGREAPPSRPSPKIVADDRRRLPSSGPVLAPGLEC